MGSEEKLRKCLNFDKCTAPLCPLDVGSKEIVWYPDETICIDKEFRNLSWVKTQRRLTKSGRKGFFNIEMLVVIRRGVTDGISPDTKQSIESWLRKRSGR